MKASTILALGFTAVAVGALGGFFLSTSGLGTGGSGKFTLKHGKSELVVDLAKGEISTDTLINKYLFADKDRETTTLALLRVRGIYSKTEPALMNQFRDLNATDPVAIAMRKLLKNLEGPFARKAHSYYDISSLSLVDGLDAAGAETTVARKIRDYCFNNKSFCRQDGVKVRVTLAKSGTIQRGNAAVCRDWEGYFSNHLSLLSNNLHTLKRLFARNYFRCEDPAAGRYAKTDELPLVQLNRDDARELFGNVIFQKGFMTATLNRSQTGTSIEEVAPELRVADSSNNINR